MNATQENPLATVGALKLPDAAALESRSQAALRMVRSFVISSDDDYTLAGDELSAVKRRHTTLEAERTKITVPMNAALKAVNELFRGPRELLETAEGLWKSKMLEYSNAARQKMEAQQRAAEEVAEAERQRLAAEAEKIRAAAAEQAKHVDAETAERIRQTAMFEAAAVEQTAAVVVAAAPATEAPAAKGVSIAKTFHAEVTDKKAFVRFVVENMDKQPELLAFLNVDGIRLDKQAKMAGDLLDWPGVTVKTKQTMRASAAG